MKFEELTLEQQTELVQWANDALTPLVNEVIKAVTEINQVFSQLANDVTKQKKR